eukprot:CAMPEP_0184328308 /NCGR_PEP_ID=MMETSP1049-20130417/143553_1 /TAXON_ID=77928 /ORGANISM="Proteomonas sulcata, Strain CCMP704" /LENGTH=141 /DNA_ID=CAMNT_0026650611 /DNA_START=589 /DNA_END=1014 /DNA_ORIENTATION=+
MGFSSFFIKITGTDVRAERHCGLASKYVVYIVKIANGDKQWVCEKRYSDFMILDEVLRSKFWYMQVPKLPGKKYFFNFDEEFVNQRKSELEDYVKALLQVACFSQSDEMWQFLTDSSSIVGVPEELKEENDRHRAALPLDP